VSDFRPFEPEARPLDLARALAFHLRFGAWARDDRDLLAAAEAVGPGLDEIDWRELRTPAEIGLAHRLLAKATVSDWSWEVSSLTGWSEEDFGRALEQLNATHPLSKI